MSKLKVSMLLAIASIAGMGSMGGPALSSSYRERGDKQHAEHLKAMRNKQRIRDEIRARREATK